MRFLFRFRFPLIVIVLILGGLSFYGALFGPAGTSLTARTIVVTPDDSLSSLANRLKEEGLIKSIWAFELAYVREQGGIALRPGGYELSASQDAWSVADTFARSPYLAWITVPRGRRKEEIADILAEALAWKAEDREAWLLATAAMPAGETEGVFFPDTYLLPSDMAPQDVARAMRDRFLETWKKFADAAELQGLTMSEVVRIASLLEREAAGAHDMPLIAGIIRERLQRGMKLQIDATLQYIKGNEELGWWKTVKSEDKYLESDFNTYQHVGLPPAAIANPGLASLQAVLAPEETNCLFYLHDNEGDIHCSANYSGHVANIRKYLQ